MNLTEKQKEQIKKWWEYSLEKAKSISNLWDTLAEKYNFNRHYDETRIGVSWEFDIKVGAVYIPDKVYDCLDEDTIEWFFWEVAGVFLRGFVETDLMPIYRWIVGWTTAGRSGGWLVLEDKELEEYVGPDGIYVSEYDIFGCNPFEYILYPFGETIIEPCSLKELLENVERNEYDWESVEKEFASLINMLDKFHLLLLNREKDLKNIYEEARRLVRDFEEAMEDLEYWKEHFVEDFKNC